MRKVETFKTPEKNSMSHWWKIKNPFRVVKNFVIIYSCRFLPSLSLKRSLYRLIGMKVGKDVSPGLMAMFDIFYPEYIEIGDNTIIGYNTTILCHEFLVTEWKLGKVIIGKNVMIGANCTVLPGVTIGDGAVISAHSLVNKNVEPNSVVGGVPARKIKKGDDDGKI